MEMNGESTIPASRQFVWDALNNPEVLKVSIPGCESLEVTAANEYTATVVSKVGPIKARFTGNVILSNIVEPKSYTLTGEGTGGTAGFAKAEIEVVLDSIEQELTLLRYVVRANVGGKLAQLGSRMIDAAARKSADDFFIAFAAEVKKLSDQKGGSTSAAASLDLQAPVESSQGVAEEASTARQNVSAAAIPLGAASALKTMAIDGSQAATAAAEILSAGAIKVWIDDSIAVVTLNRPNNRNAMTLGMWTAMPGILAALARNPDVRAMILTGAGEDFCSGADIPEFEKVRADASQATAYEIAVDACCDAIFNFPKPTIAVLKGYCLGGGAHLAMSCDFRYASPAAMFGIPAGRLSIIYGIRGTKKLMSLVGLTQAKKILFGAQRFDAQVALRIGFVDHIAKSSEATPASWIDRLFGSKRPPAVLDPMIDARKFAQAMAENAPLSIAGAKFQLNGMARGTGALDLVAAEVQIAQAASSEDYREGRKAFAEKRAPAFKGR
jgi:enoyl-CoA hydratase/carnithine racemase/carbon monoxide dehydrogenase subunit G